MIDDLTSSICLNCGYMPGAFLPGLQCPECGELIFPELCIFKTLLQMSDDVQRFMDAMTCLLVSDPKRRMQRSSGLKRGVL